MQDCPMFHIYLEDVILKNTFFDELAHLKDRWQCLKEREHKQMYFKHEPGTGVISVFFRVKLPCNLIKPYAMLQEIYMMKNWVPGVEISEIILQPS